LEENSFFSQKDLIKIAAKASSLFERLNTKNTLFVSNEKKNYSLVFDSKIEKWCQRVADNNQNLFNKRLAWDNLDLLDIYQVFLTIETGDENFSPSWLEILKLIGQTVSCELTENLQNSGLNNNAAINDEIVAFQEIFSPFICVARQRLLEQTSSSYFLLSESAHASLEHALLKRLSFLASQALALKFSAYKAFNQPASARLFRFAEDSCSKVYYTAFIKTMLNSELLSWLQEYSVLARLLAVATDQWVESTGEFLQRLESDWFKIQNKFQSGQELGKVDTVKSGLSDFHNYGRQVISVLFTSGLQLIYKPRNLGIEESYFNLLNWLNRKELSLPFKLLKVLNYSTHGWVEFIEHLPCYSQEQAKRYYYRVGMLLCVLYMLKATDCHYENIIASNEYPVLIDLETLMHHYISNEALSDTSEAHILALHKLRKSVLGIILLPQWELQQNGSVHDVSGLSNKRIPLRLLQWQNINTDNMTLKYKEITGEQAVNLPLLKEISLSPEDYVEDLISGFREVYQVFLKYKNEILGIESLFSNLFKQQIRFIYRNSMSYGLALQKVLHPKFLRDGVDRSIELDIFSKDLLKLNSKPLSWELLQAEQQALNQLDIPYFTTRPDSRHLTVSPSKVIENYFTDSSKNQVISHLESLSPEDLEQQIRYIRSTLYSQKSVKSKFSCPDHTTVTNFSEIAPITQNEIVTQVTSIANKIQQEAICGTDGSATWITLGIVPGTEKFQVQPMDYSLYEGNCGVALFLAALESVTGNSTFRPLALAALQPIRQNCGEAAWSQAITKEMGIGGASGLGSLIYAFVRISQFLREPQLIEDAKKLACLVTPESIAADCTFDVMSGASGAILGLLALYDAYPDSDILERLLSCGHHLLSHRVTSKSGYRAWATYQKRILTGFSHGAAGIAYALLRLYAVTQEQSFREAAEEAIAYERSVFSAQASNWPDFRFSSMTGDDQPTFANSWCHGASGIGLARLGSLKILDTKETRREIDNALQITQKMNLQGVDHLCCGHFGRIELFLMASLALPRNNLLEVAQKYANWVIQNSMKTGSFHLLYGEFNSIYLRSFFQGTSGIGYELLRLAYPTKLPSVLLWE